MKTKLTTTLRRIFVKNFALPSEINCQHINLMNATTAIYDVKTKTKNCIKSHNAVK